MKPLIVRENGITRAYKLVEFVPMYPQECAIYSEGKYTAHYGKLSHEDSRWYYVTGPCLNGRIAPIGSFYNEGEAIRFVKEKANA